MQAADAAEAFGYPVALKVESYVIQHKTDVGGVRLGLQDRAAVKEAFLQMDSAMKRLDPSACVTGAADGRKADLK